MQMEEARDVVKIASGFLAAQEPEAQISRLEQIEELEDGEWSVVLSFPDFSTKNVAMLLGNQSPNRVYKQLVVNSKAKEVIALRFWK